MDKADQRDFDSHYEYWDKIKPCPHLETIALNEEGYAGIFCTKCGKQLEEEC